MDVVQLPLDEILPDDRNPRIHGERNIEAIMDSFRQFGQVEPLLVQEGTNKLIAGHGRLEALRRLGRDEADVVLLDIDEQAAMALNIALNRTAELAEWNIDTLGDLLGDLTGYDLGFDQGESACLVGEEYEAVSDITDRPPDDTQRLTFILPGGVVDRVRQHLKQYGPDKNEAIQRWLEASRSE
jgi:hypothetical protein